MNKFLVVFVLISYAAFGQDKTQIIPVKCFTGKTQHQVERVVDQDTVLLRHNKELLMVRLLGVDGSGDKSVTQGSVKFLTNLLKGESVYLEFDGDGLQKDEHGRALAYLFRAPDGLFVNLEMLRQGYAKIKIRRGFKYMAQFQVWEKRAKTAEKGRWERLKPVAKIIRIETNLHVFIQKNSKIYHRPSCQELRQGKMAGGRRSISLEKAKALGYKPCARCDPVK